MLKALIVEDDPMVAKLNEIFLAEFDEIEVSAKIGDGQEAIEYLKANPVDLVILDVYMPIVTGIEVLKFIKQNALTCDVIMITAATETAVLDEILHLGVLDYLVKPFEKERFDAAIAGFLVRTNLIRNVGKADQKIVDNILNKKYRSPHLDKGMTQTTLDSVQKAAKKCEGYFSCAELAEKLSLSKVTARRYLNYLVETGSLRSQVDYSTGGRPCVKYKAIF